MRREALTGVLNSLLFRFLVVSLFTLLLLGESTLLRRSPRHRSRETESKETEAHTSASTEALQKATQNPVASLISVPVQNNNNFGINPGYRNQDVLNIQPVIPIGISKNWNLLVRWIAPVVYQMEEKLKQLAQQQPEKK